MTAPKPKILFPIVSLFAGIFIFFHMSRQSALIGKITFLWNNSSIISLKDETVKLTKNHVITMPPSKIVARKISHEDAYKQILKIDYRTPFLDHYVRLFLKQSRFYTFPSKYKQVFVDTLVEFDRIWRQKLNRTYILYGGTLLGAYRHGQTIPWDDDLDILVDLKYNKTLKQDFNGTKLATSYIASICKLFFTHNGTTTNRYGHWPFIDLFFFKPIENGTLLKIMGYNLVYSTNSLFPATPIPFENHFFFGPRCPEKVIESTKVDKFSTKCCTQVYNHRLDRSRSTYCILCSKLHGLFRFVTWRRINATHSQQMISDPPEPNEMAAVYESKDENWEKGPVVFMPKC